MSVSPHSAIFFGALIGEEGTWKNDPAYTEVPKCIKDLDLPKGCPLEVVEAGIASSGMFYSGLAVKASITRCGYRTDLTGTTILSHTPADIVRWTADFWRAVDDMGIPHKLVAQANPEGPKWLVMAYTG